MKLFGAVRFTILLAVVVFGLAFIIGATGCSKGGGGVTREAQDDFTCTDADVDGYYAEAGCGTLIDPDDSDPTIYPGAKEVCGDNIDNDGDGLIDEGCGPGCTDADGDGYYDREGCVTLVDCDDDDAAVHPRATEICADDVDNDCDGLIDEGCTPEVCGDGVDNDGDGFIDEECVPGTSSVPDTGQTICSDADGRLFPCPSPGQAFYGQDACYPFTSSPFTKLDKNGNALSDDAISWFMVKDNITGLIWEVKTDDGGVQDKDYRYVWDAAEGLLHDLNFEIRLGGYSDWRLPTIKELAYIVDYGTYGPAINLYYFPNTMYDSYWSSTTHAGDVDLAWRLNFFDGRPDIKTKEELGHVRAVRGAMSASSFTDNGNNTVTDNGTGLMWMTLTASDIQTWQGALDYCEKLAFAGYTDWRLPNIKELRSLVDYTVNSPAIDLNYFPDTPSSPYWSSTSYHSDRVLAWLVGFDDGAGGGTQKTNTTYVRAVRGGQ